MTVTPEELAAVRKKMMDKKGTFRRDPTKFSVDKSKLPKDGSLVVYRLRILPSIKKGDKVLDGDKPVVADSSVDWCIEHGSHWFNNRSFECPRIVSEGGVCPICKIGFDLFKQYAEKDKRTQIAKTYLPKSFWAVNAYFLNISQNPEEVRGKIMWMDLNKTLYDICEQCIMADGTTTSSSSDEEAEAAEPQPFGAFFDQDEGYILQIEARLGKGGYPTYQSSRFIGRSKGPLAKKAGGKEADQAKIKEILERRQLLTRKIEAVKIEELKRIAESVADDDVGEENHDVAEQAANKEKVVRPGSKSRPLPLPEVEPDLEEEVEAGVPFPPEEEEPSTPSAESEDITEEPKVEKPKGKPKEEKPKEEKPKEEAVAPDDEDPEIQSLLASIQKGGKKKP